jgi:ribosomal-protein-alanine N-acetyltransferase
VVTLDTGQVLTTNTLAPEFDGVRLRAFEPRDVGMVRDLATDPYVPQIGSLVADADEAQALEWIENQNDRAAAGRGFSWCIAEVTDDRAVGAAGLTLSTPEQGRAAAGYAVAPAERGRGIAARALMAVTRFAWTLGEQDGVELHRVELYIEPWNVASTRVAERAGYVREGLLRSHQVIGGRRVDMELWAALRPD